jgi:hypothetical protein
VLSPLTGTGLTCVSAVFEIVLRTVLLIPILQERHFIQVRITWAKERMVCRCGTFIDMFFSSSKSSRKADHFSLDLSRESAPSASPPFNDACDARWSLLCGADLSAPSSPAFTDWRNPASDNLPAADFSLLDFDFVWRPLSPSPALLSSSSAVLALEIALNRATTVKQ